MMSTQAECPIGSMSRGRCPLRRGFYAWQSRQPLERALADGGLANLIRPVHIASGKGYGARRIFAARADVGVRGGR